VSHKLILGRVNNEGAIFHVFPDAQKAQVANARLDNYLVIVLSGFIFLWDKNQYCYSLGYILLLHFNSPHSVEQQSSMAR
jgi:hypothetical protein